VHAIAYMCVVCRGINWENKNLFSVSFLEEMVLPLCDQRPIQQQDGCFIIIYIF
jgi:hypothetical protein